MSEQNKKRNTPSSELSNHPAFFDNIVSIIENARRFVGRTADLTLCVTYYEIGRMIVEEEQGGKARAEYGKSLLNKLSIFLKNRIGKGFSESNLRNARKFYQVYAPSIQQLMTAELGEARKIEIQQLLTAKSQNNRLLTDLFKVSWTHYVVLMRIENDSERNFYEIEAAKNGWAVEDLRRQYASSLYERLALSRDKEEVMRLANEGLTIQKPRDLLKNPLVLDFLDMEEHTAYSETDLEKAIISKLQQFLLELGKGFLFEARQKRFTFQEKHFKVDLVTYNRLLKCYVVIDFKIDDLTHQDLGQMQMYVHYFDRYVKTADENLTVGILICGKKDDAIVELTLPEGENIYAAEYSLYLPDKNLLQSKLAQWIAEFEEVQTTLDIAEGGDVE